LLKFTSQYSLPLASAYLEELKRTEHEEKKLVAVPNDILADPEQNMDIIMTEPEQSEPAPSKVDELISKRTGTANECEGGTDVPTRFREKKRLHWTGKTCTWT
jgi:tRNA-dihydrouridine synthase 3